MLKLSDRMNKILSLCESFGVWADIGCDHGIISAELVLQKKADKVIASDISEASLYKAKDLALALGLTNKIECRIGSGFNVLTPGEAEGAVLAGMGTPLIIKIILESMNVSKRLKSIVVSSNNYHDRLRKWLVENGFTILKEEIVEDSKRFYPVMKITSGECCHYTNNELLAGRNVLIDEAYKKYIDWLIEREQEIIAQITLGGNDPSLHIEKKRIYEEIKNDRC